MKKVTSLIFQPLKGLEGLFILQENNLRSSAIRLCDGSLCIYSPIAGTANAAQESLSKLGEVSILLAPNHYHNKGLAEYQEVFPDADLSCSTTALPRLSKVTGLKFKGLEAVKDQLSTNTRILEPEGLKTGEIWVQIQSKIHVVWIVTDAFTAPPTLAGKYSQEPSLLNAFPKYGVKDRAQYIRWVEVEIAGLAPTTLVPCHGGLLKSKNLGLALVKLLKTSL